MPPSPDADRETVETIIAFLKETYAGRPAVIAVSGGIDSAVALTLLCLALGPDRVTPLFLPYGDQDMADAWAVTRGNSIADVACVTVNISPVADAAIAALGIGTEDNVRRGNIMARSRMIVVYDNAKKRGALVCGTENKSEKYLGYFTRFGDAASDVEPITNLYKTDVRRIAAMLGIPKTILDKAPSAGLWSGQTDEGEMGFTYAQADAVLARYVDAGEEPSAIHIDGIDPDTVHRVVSRVQSQAFKHAVPYAAPDGQ